MMEVSTMAMDNDAGSVGVLAKRGLQIRQRRTINVAKALDSDCDRPGQYQPDMAINSTSEKLAPKYAPIRYIPAREAQKNSVPSDSNGEYSKTSAYDFSSGHAQSNPYNSYSRCEAPTQREPTSSLVTTARGLFKMRPRRDYRRKSIDVLEHDADTLLKHDTTAESSQTSDNSGASGFIKENTGTKDRLARRERQSLSDMLGSSRNARVPSEVYDHGSYNPAFVSDTRTTSGSHQLNYPLQDFQPSYESSEPTTQNGLYGTGQSELGPYGMDQLNPDIQSAVYSGDPSYNVEQTESGIQYDPNSIEQNGRDQQYVSNDMYNPSEQLSGVPISDDIYSQAFVPEQDTSTRAYPGTLIDTHSNPDRHQETFEEKKARILGTAALSVQNGTQNEQNLSRPAEIYETFEEKKARMMEEAKARIFGTTGSYTHNGIQNEQRLANPAAIYETLEEKKARMMEEAKARIFGTTGSSMHNGIRNEQSLANPAAIYETLEEKKARIMEETKPRILGTTGSYMHNGIQNEQHLVKPASIYETLEEKKARIMDNLRHKHSGNIQAQNLLSATSSIVETRPGRSMSVGNTERNSSNDFHSNDLGHQTSPGFKSAYDFMGEHDSQSHNYVHPDEYTTNDSYSKGPYSHKDTVDTYSNNNVPEYHNVAQSIITTFGESHSQGQSPNDDMMSVDSGFHDRVALEISTKNNKTTPVHIKAQKEPDRSDIDHKELQTSNLVSKSPFLQQKQEELKGSGGRKPNDYKCQSLKDTSVKDVSANKREAPPTKPKPKQQPSRPKSAPPNKSKSTTNLHEAGLAPMRERRNSITKDTENSVASRRERWASLSKDTATPRKERSSSVTKEAETGSSTKERRVSSVTKVPDFGRERRLSVSKEPENNSTTQRERRNSVSKDSDTSDGSSFNRNSRFRSSTKAWEMRQAEKQAELKAKSNPTTPRKSVPGKVTLSWEGSQSKPTPVSKSSNDYDKPWRTGSATVKGSASGSVRERVEKLTTSGKQSPKSSGNSSRSHSPSSLKPPRNPTKDTSYSSRLPSRQGDKRN